MTDLIDLCNTLQSLADSCDSAKVSFYYLGDDGVVLRSGAILVDHGVTAYVDHQQLPLELAIASIPTLKLVKVASLQLMEVSAAGSHHPVELPVLINRLLAGRQSSMQAQAPQPAPYAAPVPAVRLAPDDIETPTPLPATPVTDIKIEASRLLEPLFGVSANRKVDEFAILHPPSEHPYEFLLQCQRHAAIMLGGSKAEAMFRPLYDKLESERIQRRR